MTRSPVTPARARIQPASALTIERVAALRTQRARDETGTYLAEGVRFLVAAVDARVPIEALVVAPPLLRSPIGQLLARRLRQRGVPVLRVDREGYLALSTSREPQGVALVIRQRIEKLSSVRVDRGACFLALENLQTPGNLGTLLRTSEAAGATGLIALGPTVDPFDPNVVRASMGAFFTRRILRGSPSELRTWARAHDVLVVGGTGDAEKDYRSVSYEGPVVLALGSERHGLSPAARDACDAVVRIPMLGRTDSLNLAVAGSLLLYEVWRQRHPLRAPLGV